MKNVVSQTYSAGDYITLTELKAHLRVTSSDDDGYLALLLNSVFDYASNYCGYELRKSTVDYFFTSPDEISQFHIPARLQSITSVKYRDSNGALQTLGTSAYDSTLTISANFGYSVTLIDAPSSLYSYGWRYKVTVVEGWGKVGDSIDYSKIFPDGLRAALYLFAEHLYTNRGSQVVGVSSSMLDWNHEHLLSPYSIKAFV